MYTFGRVVGHQLQLKELRYVKHHGKPNSDGTKQRLAFELSHGMADAVVSLQSDAHGQGDRTHACNMR